MGVVFLKQQISILCRFEGLNTGQKDEIFTKIHKLKFKLFIFWLSFWCEQFW